MARDVAAAIRAAQELAPLDLGDALDVIVLLGEVGDPRFEPWAARWAARVAAERNSSRRPSRRSAGCCGRCRDRTRRERSQRHYARTRRRLGRGADEHASPSGRRRRRRRRRAVNSTDRWSPHRSRATTPRLAICRMVCSCRLLDKFNGPDERGYARPDRLHRRTSFGAPHTVDVAASFWRVRTRTLTAAIGVS